MSGIASVIFIIIALAFRISEIGQARYWVAAAVLSYMIASFSAWRKERVAIGRLELTIEGLTQSTGDTSLTPGELVGLFKDRTTIQGERLASAYLGRRMPVSVVVDDVGTAVGQVYVSGYSDPGHIRLAMYFDKDRTEAISVLVKGDKVSIIGEIARVSSGNVGLEHCEIVKLLDI